VGDVARPGAPALGQQAGRGRRTREGRGRAGPQPVEGDGDEAPPRSGGLGERVVASLPAELLDERRSPELLDQEGHHDGRTGDVPHLAANGEVTFVLVRQHDRWRIASAQTTPVAA
jgi:hypothetical protein